MTRKLQGIGKYLILTCVFILCSGISLFSQRKINGIINKYARVSSLGTDFVTVEDDLQFGQFSRGDTVLLVQMKGARIYTSESSSYGDAYFAEGRPGMHEFLTIQSVDNATNTIVFRNNVINTGFDVSCGLQIIRVPSYGSVLVDAVLTCEPWDSISGTGGVLAAIISKTLSLNADIDVSGTGFRGGAITAGLGICGKDNPQKLDRFAYSAFTDSSGYKGEGLAVRANPGGGPPFLPVFPAFAKGRGANFNGGGGGNGRFSGGGGGANYGAGGQGGLEALFCIPNRSGGNGGKSVLLTPLDNGLFLGGGGGSSTYISGGSPVPGGNGGGMVILMCDTLSGNGHAILANGSQPGTASGNAGAGSGGAGGSVALFLRSYSLPGPGSAVTIRAEGGRGGNNSGNSGNGGGGGGGLIATSDVTLPGNVIRSVQGGVAGSRTGGAAGATAGQAGVIRNTFNPLLNGFLFNSVYSSVTGNLVDSICSDVVPKQVTGTSPAGGSGPYSYIWQRSNDPSSSASVISGADSRNYIPSDPESSTFWLRRIVRDQSSGLTDTSKWVKIIVQPAIAGNLVGKDTIICHNQNPLVLKPLNSGPSNGNGTYQYKWRQSNSDSNWDTAPEASGAVADLDSFDPPALVSTTYYRRFVTSGRCVSQSPTVTITVLPRLTGNVSLRSDSVICEGMLFNTLGATAPAGGSGSYTFQWQESISGDTWQPASGVNNLQTYNPDTAQFASVENRYFRRIVLSGPYDVCRHTSSPMRLTRYHAIRDNTISEGATICAGSAPPALTGSMPMGGSGSYTYLWQDSSASATWTTRSSAGFSYSPSALNDSVWYRRIVRSSKCSDTSRVSVVKVHAPVTGNVIGLISGSGPDTTICSGSVPNMIVSSGSPSGGTGIPGSYSYQWYLSHDNSVYTQADGSGTLPDYQPSALTTTLYFRRRVTSGMCSSESNPVRINVLPGIKDNLISPARPAVCYNTVPGLITGTPLTGGAGNSQTWVWQDSTSGVSWKNISPGNVQSLQPSDALTERTWFRRIIRSGPSDCCLDTSAIVMIDVNPLPTASIVSVTDTAMCSGSAVSLRLHLTGKPGWKVVYGENGTPVSLAGITDPDPLVKRTPLPSAPSAVFSYSLLSVEDDNGCIATSLTGSRNVTVYRTPVADAGPDTEVCGPVARLAAVPGPGTGTWYFPPQVIQSVPSDHNTTVHIDSSFTSPSVSYKFYWEERNWLCYGRDSVTFTFYKRIDDINAGRDTSLMTIDYLFPLKASLPLPHETGEWSVVSGSGNFDDRNSHDTYVRNIAPGSNTYKWAVTNGKCRLEDVVNVNIVSLVIPGGISPNGDNINDSLIISGLDLDNQTAELTIINGAGTQVYSTSNRNGSRWRNWDGRNSSGTELPEGTYYYMLRIISQQTGHVVSKSGFIILRRN
ncbi:MAG TPA: gliding motility-associated C-terminal domain-containing protein [Bacteroidales bacterium]|jgi:gliding motility-associated-like protein|nr:gliding motility-associated C-terminal domain-containing protein [Bacteroidales bacterium]